MPVYDGDEFAHEHLLDIAGHVVQSALHAPQVTGYLELKTQILTGEEIEPIVKIFQVMSKVVKFIKLSASAYSNYYESRKGPVLVLMGADLSNSEMNWDCGACGFKSCLEFNKYARENRGLGTIWGGPSCNWKAFDFGMANVYAADAAGRYDIDNRIEASSGLLSHLLGYLEGCTAFVGLPLGPCRESWWYNRPAYRYSYEDWKYLLATGLPHAMLPFVGTGKPPIKFKDRWWQKPQLFIKLEEDPEHMAELGEVQQKVGKIIQEARETIENKKKTKE